MFCVQSLAVKIIEKKKMSGKNSKTSFRNEVRVTADQSVTRWLTRSIRFAFSKSCSTRAL
jgi:hypothetical protein